MSGVQPTDPRGTRDTAAPRRGPWSWIGRGGVAAVRGLGLCGLMVAGTVLVLFLSTTAVFAALGYGLYAVLGGRRLAIAAAVVVPLLGVALAVLHKGALSIPLVVVLAVSLPLVPAALVAGRRLAILTRRLSGEWCEVSIADPYRPPPGGERLSVRGRLGWLLGDPASWRDLTGRPPAPVESAAYFAVSELLANVSKHAHARQAWVDLRHEGGMLRVGVSDDGAGRRGPGPGHGAGWHRTQACRPGWRARGPTVVNMEIPCALSSPKTSSC